MKNFPPRNNKNKNTGLENTGPENETPEAAAAWLLAIASQNVETVDILPAESVRPSDETAKRIAAKLPAGRIGPVYCFCSEAEAWAVAVRAAKSADQRRRFVPAWGLLHGRYYFACLASADFVPVTLETATVAELAAEIHRRQAVALVIEPEDLASYWQCDESGATSPATDVPDGETWEMCRRAFERWQDSGAFTECMERMRDAWNECNRRRNGKKRESK